MSQMKVPRCPNHNEPLEIPWDKKFQRKGSAPCPVSKCLFEYEMDGDEAKAEKDKYGNLIYSVSVVGEETDNKQ